MKPVFQFLWAGLFSAALLPAQTLPLRLLPKPARLALQDYVLIPSGVFSQGLFNGHDSLQPVTNPQTISVDSFLMSRFETTVGEYEQYAQATGDRADSTAWATGFPSAYNEPMIWNYFRHPAFFQYPILCVSWDQAQRYCQWKTEQINALLRNSPYVVEIRLPLAAEWEYAALGQPDPGAKPLNKDRRIFPWDGSFLSGGAKPCSYIHCNSGAVPTDHDMTLLGHPYDGGLYTVQVQSYEPNGFGLYQMAGNAAEWTADDYSSGARPGHHGEMNPAVLPRPGQEYKIVKGGSWNDPPFYQQCGVFQIREAGRASPTIGFRPVCVIGRRN